MAQAREWERDGHVVWSYDDDYAYDAKCDWVDEARPAEVRPKAINMVLKKNSKTKADVAKEEYGPGNV